MTLSTVILVWSPAPAPILCVTWPCLSFPSVQSGEYLILPLTEVAANILSLTVYEFLKYNSNDYRKKKALKKLKTIYKYVWKGASKVNFLTLGARKICNPRVSWRKYIDWIAWLSRFFQLLFTMGLYDLVEFNSKKLDPKIW